FDLGRWLSPPHPQSLPVEGREVRPVVLAAPPPNLPLKQGEVRIGDGAMSESHRSTPPPGKGEVGWGWARDPLSTSAPDAAGWDLGMGGKATMVRHGEKN